MHVYPVAVQPGQLQVVGEDGHVRRWSDLEREILRAAEKRYRGSKSEVARRLGIGRATLYRMLMLHEEADGG